MYIGEPVSHITGKTHIHTDLINQAIIAPGQTRMLPKDTPCRGIGNMPAVRPRGTTHLFVSLQTPIRTAGQVCILACDASLLCSSGIGTGNFLFHHKVFDLLSHQRYP